MGATTFLGSIASPTLSQLVTTVASLATTATALPSPPIVSSSPPSPALMTEQVIGSLKIKVCAANQIRDHKFAPLYTKDNLYTLKLKECDGMFDRVTTCSDSFTKFARQAPSTITPDLTTVQRYTSFMDQLSTIRETLRTYNRCNPFMIVKLKRDANGKLTDELEKEAIDSFKDPSEVTMEDCASSNEW